jgi:hypothetical protein
LIEKKEREEGEERKRRKKRRRIRIGIWWVKYTEGREGLE